MQDFIQVKVNSSGPMIDAVEGIFREAAQQAANLISDSGETAIVEVSFDSFSERIAPDA